MNEIKQLQQLAGILTEIKVGKPISIVLTIGNIYKIQFMDGDWHDGKLVGIYPKDKYKTKFETEHGSYYLTQKQMETRLKNK